ncbi:hypothetical protein [Halarchaeum sp. P4]|uniref:hypothetical protein n=1 Tax=Halarchaeum sp. P4 TaxID=3421639 RepID=UPI003EB718BD
MAGQDDRGVSTLVGAILLFGIILVVYATWQAAVVPAENKQVEFDAFQEAGEDVTELQNALQRAGAFGVQTSTVVHAGARYPPRVLFVNPPPATGTLSTQPAGDVTFSNVAATDKDVRDYWNSSERSLAFQTHHVVLRTDYNELRANDLGIDPSGAVYLAAGTNSVMRDAQSLVNGNRITLVTVAGGYREGGVTVSPAVRPVSVSTETISIRNTSGDFTMTVPTRLSEDAWESINRSQATIDRVSVSGNNVTITFHDGSYQLRLSKVALREPTDAAIDTNTSARYITAANSDAVTVDTSPVRLVTYTRDKYNNPRGHVSVRFNMTNTSRNTKIADPNGGSCTAVDWNDATSTSTVRSDADGTAIACLKPTKKNSKEIRVRATMQDHLASDISTDARSVRFNVTVV